MYLSVDSHTVASNDPVICYGSQVRLVCYYPNVLDVVDGEMVYETTTPFWKENLSSYQLLSKQHLQLLLVAIVTLGYNASNLTSGVWYKVVVVETCNNTIGIKSDPKDAYFNTSVEDVHIAGMYEYHIHASDMQYVQYWVCLYVDMNGR